jgi:hypothetical protein
VSFNLLLSYCENFNYRLCARKFLFRFCYDVFISHDSSDLNEITCKIILDNYDLIDILDGNEKFCVYWGLSEFRNMCLVLILDQLFWSLN